MSNETIAEQEAPAGGGEEVSNEFDFSQVEAAPETDAAETNEEAEDTPEEVEENKEYALNLEGLDAEDTPYADIFTQHAKSAGLDAGAASQFIVGFTKSMHELHMQQEAEAVAELKQEWGKDFEGHKRQTLTFMKQLFDKAGLTEEEMALFANARGARIGRKLMTAMGARKPLSANAASVAVHRSPQEQIDALLVEMYEKQARPDCNPDDIIAIKAKINKIAGMKLY